MEPSRAAAVPVRRQRPRRARRRAAATAPAPSPPVIRNRRPGAQQQQPKTARPVAVGKPSTTGKARKRPHTAPAPAPTATTKPVRAQKAAAPKTAKTAEKTAKAAAATTTEPVLGPKLDLLGLAKTLAGACEALNMTEALVATDEKPHAVIQAIASREKRLRELEATLALEKAKPGVLSRQLDRLEAEARRRLERFRKLLNRNPEEARPVLEAMLDGPLKFVPVETPDGRRYRVEGSVRLGALFPIVSDPTGN